MRRSLSLSALVCALSAAAAPAQAPRPAEARASFYDPAISPDRSEIAFVSGGDVWTVPAAGGDARLLVSNPASESRPLYSPDGGRLAFVSTRTGNGDLYVLTLATGALQRVTFDDALDQLDAWSADGRWLYFTSSRGDIQGQNDIWRVRAEGGTPMPVAADRYVNEFWSAPAPDGQTLAITARGTVSGQWWRRGHSHLDESEIWLVRDGDRPQYEAVTTGGVKDAWPMWAGAERRTLYFVRDDHGVENVFARGADGRPAAVTHFTAGRVLWPSASADGRAIVFERDLGVWLLDPATGEAHQVPIALRGAPAAAGLEHVRVSDGLSEMALSPDGKKVAFAARGDVFAASAKDGGDAERVTSTTAREQELAWLPDSRQLVYVSSRAGYAQLFVYDFAARSETALTNDPRGDTNPHVSPDGRSVAFTRGGHELDVVDVGSKAVRTLAAGFFDRLPFTSGGEFAWSPDGRWFAYTTAGVSMFTTVYVVPATGGEARAVSFLPNVFGGGVSWSPDGKYLLFTTSQRTESTQLARIDLVPRTPLFREEQFRDLFRQPARPALAPPADPRPAPPAAPPARGARAAAAPADTATRARSDSAARPPVRIVFDAIRRRVSFLPVGVEANAAVIAPDGKSVLLVAFAAGQQNLYTYSLDELSREDPVARQLTSTPGGKSSVQWAPDGKEVWYLQNGRINVVTVEGRATRQVAVTAELDVDFDAQKVVMFDEAYRFLRDGFHDSTMNGVDWDAVHAQYAPWAAGARTGDEERRIIALMIGELNASHSGVSAPFSAGTPAYVGRLGLDFDRAEYERSGRFRITNVIPLGPAAVAGSVAAGDYLLAVDGARLGARTNLDSVLSYTIGREVTLTVSHAADGGSPGDVKLKPVNLATERGLRYRQWVEDRRAYVARVSNGRLGYVHMVDMGQGSLEQLYQDLDSENRGRDGVVIDVRHNNGGFVNAYAIDVFARRGYLTMTYRGAGLSAPARTILGQRSLEKPTILVTDQHSLSDAEDFTEGYRALHLGKVVGEPTAGWIIYTSSGTLIDGSAVRMPFITVRGSDGQVMEMHPRPVDVPVVRPVGESYTGRDAQLDAAVRELLQQIGGR